MGASVHAVAAPRPARAELDPFSIDALNARAFGEAGAASEGAPAGWRARAARRRASIWQEIHRELRRHAGDERLPFDLRGALRRAAHRAHERSEAAARRAGPPPLARRWLRDAPRVDMPDGLERRMRETAAAAGVDPDGPIVTLEIRSAVENFFEAIDDLRARGYQAVRIGRADAGPLRRPGVVDLAPLPRSAAADVYILLRSRFLVCEGGAVQRAAYLTHTPTLLLGAPDPFSGYPVRRDGLYTLAAVVDLDTGRTLDPADLLTETFFRNARNCGYRSHTPAEIRAAVAELEEGLRQGWPETDSQARFRSRVAAASAALSHLPHVARWGADEGFIGDGRLARFQADRT